MAKIGTLGDIVFSVSKNTVKTFEGLKIDGKTNYAKHTRHWSFSTTILTQPVLLYTCPLF